MNVPSECCSLILLLTSLGKTDLKACVSYFSLFLKVQCVSWLFQMKYLKRNLTYSCFIFPLFHKRLFSLGLPRATRLLETSCLEKNKCMCNQDNALDVGCLSKWIKCEEKWASKSSTNQDKIATVLTIYLNDWKNILPLFKF